MVEAVTRQGRVVGLYVEAVLAVKVVPCEEAVNDRGIMVVLVLGGLVRLGLDEKQALESDSVLVLGDEGQEAGQLRRIVA